MISLIAMFLLIVVCVLFSYSYFEFTVNSILYKVICMDLYYEIISHLITVRRNVFAMKSIFFYPFITIN